MSDDTADDQGGFADDPDHVAEDQDDLVEDPDRIVDDLADLLPGARNNLANHPMTIKFLQAGARLLHTDFARDAADEFTHPKAGRPPFEELLAWLSRGRIVREAQRAWERIGRNDPGSLTTVSAFRHRWNKQADYLRDLVIWTLLPRKQGPNRVQIDEARRVVGDVRAGRRLLHQAIEEIAWTTVRTLTLDKAFRLQLVFQATLAHDGGVRDMLRRVDLANIEAWKDFYIWALDEIGLTRTRQGLEIEDLAKALHAAAEGVVVRALLNPRLRTNTATRVLDEDADRPSLALIVKALLAAFVDRGDGKSLDDIIDDIPR